MTVAQHSAAAVHPALLPSSASSAWGLAAAAAVPAAAVSHLAAAGEGVPASHFPTAWVPPAVLLLCHYLLAASAAAAAVGVLDQELLEKLLEELLDG